MMKEGVHSGSHGPLLHLSDELGRFTGAWNGIPVTIQHPEREGGYVSANSPDVIEQEKVGVVYNTLMDGGDLKSEVWFDEAKLQQISPETLRAIINRRPLDVSVGVFTDDEESTGIWNGEEYSAIARNHRPDHLAVLPGAQGACSWADGCGIRLNKKGGEASVEINVNALNYSGVESIGWNSPALSDFDVSEARWQDLSRAEKAKVASHFLIGNASVETFGDLHFPVVNPATNKLNERALRAVIGGRGAQLTAVPAAVRDAARRRAYRLLNDEFDAGLEIPETLSLANQLRKQGFAVNQISEDPGYQTIVRTIQGKLDSMDTDTRIHFLQEVYDDYFIYDVRQNGNSTFYQRNYSIGDNESIEFEGEPSEVLRRVIYQPTNNKGGVITMCDVNEKCAGLSARVDCLIKNNSKFEEGDRPWLSTFSEEQIDKIIAVPEKETEKGAEKGSEKGAEADPQMNKDQAVQVLKEHLSDPTKFMGLLPDETRAQMEYGMKAYKQKRSELIEHIAANTEVYSKEALGGRDIEELERLAKVVKPKADYSVMGIQGNASVGSEDVLLPPGVEAE